MKVISKYADVTIDISLSLEEAKRMCRLLYRSEGASWAGDFCIVPGKGGHLCGLLQAEILKVDPDFLI